MHGYSCDINNGLVWHSNGTKLYDSQMVGYSDHIWKADSFICFSNGLTNYCGDPKTGSLWILNGQK